MSSDHPSDVPSAAPDDPEAGLGLAATLRARGAPLLEALERHRPGALDHGEGTASYAFAAAVELGLGRSRSEAAREAARLHEIGQVYVPATVLELPESARSPEQAAAYGSHFEAGYRLARGAGLPEPVCGWLLRARERYDGRGPERLAADAIPLEARIIHAACLCQTALAAPVAPGGLTPDRRATEVLRARAGADLDPQVGAALISIVERAAGGG